MQAWLRPHSQQLAKLVLANRLHHASLFVGLAGVGKSELMTWLSALLLCQQPALAGACDQCKSCLLRIAGNHPDLLVVGDESNVGVDQIRALNLFTQQTAQLGGVKVLRIDLLERLTESAANALLKTLEEPPGRCVFVLSTAQIAKLPATIVSRCNQWPINVTVTDNLSAEAGDALALVFQQQPLLLTQLREHHPKLDSLAELIAGFCQSSGSLAQIEAILLADLPITPYFIRIFMYYLQLGMAQNPIQANAMLLRLHTFSKQWLQTGVNQPLLVKRLMIELSQ